MRPDVARRPRSAASRPFGSALLVALVMIGAVSMALPRDALAATTMAAACDFVNLRTGPSTGASKVTSVSTGTQVGVEATVTDGAWSTTCANGPVSGSTWYQISQVNGQTVASLFGVDVRLRRDRLVRAGRDARARRPPRHRIRPPRRPRRPTRSRRRPRPDPLRHARPRPRRPPPPRCLPVTEGIDVSHWQNTIDWTQVAAAGKRFAFMKASEGTTLADPTYATNRSQAKAVGLYVGAYHFARPDRTPGDAVAEADYFLAMSQLEAGDLVPVLDLEDAGGLSPAELQEWVKGYLGRIYERTGAHAMIYASPTFWKNAMGDTTWFATNGYGMVWVAHWTSGPAPTVPAQNWGGTGWTFWQYTSSGSVPGISGRVDLDRFNGLDLTPLLLTSGVIQQAGPTLNVTPSSSVITWGDTVVLKASFGTLGAGRSFDLQASADGVTWQTIATVTTDAEGNASFSYRPATNLFYRGVFAGAPDLAAVTSPTARVVVRQIALLRPTANGADAGSSVAGAR